MFETFQTCLIKHEMALIFQIMEVQYYFRVKVGSII